MLSRIFIQNFALIESLEINLHSGLQVITGETGAGKSIILGALRLILGERADIKSISEAGEKSIVEAEFSLNPVFQSFFDENDLDYDAQTIIRREILPSGKSRAFVNDVPVTLDVLKTLSQRLIDIHSQFETSKLFDEAYQFKIIDGLGENKVTIEAYQAQFQALKNLRARLSKLEKQLAEGNKEADYKSYLLNELETASLDNLDLEDLQSQLSMQENAEQIAESLAEILKRFDQEEIGVLDALLEVRNKLGKTAQLSHHFSEFSARFESLFVEIKDMVFELQNEAEKMETKPDVLEELTAKVNTINALMLKHQVTSVEDLVSLRDQLAEEQSNFNDLEDNISDIQQQISTHETSLNKLAEALSENRKKSIPVFKEKAEALLKKLGLEKAKIDVQLTPLQEFSTFGKEQIEILFQANPGFPMKPIQTAISGGERSRVMLAIKKIMAENQELPTLILDEIDTGVSGKVASEMGDVMHEMADHMQLIVITHLAQVAAKGDKNYKVVKSEVAGKTQTTILSLSPDEKLQEIAQLLSGSKITDAAMTQAQELINS